jgi:hypothetical protein
MTVGVVVSPELGARLAGGWRGAAQALGGRGQPVGAGRAVAAQAERRFRHPGRRRLDDRMALCGILFVLYTGIPWEFLPPELGYGSGVTCWHL